MEEDRDPNEIKEQQEEILEQMEVEEQDSIGAPIKRGMGISVAPKKYQPTPPRYIRAGENSEDEEDGQDVEETLKLLIWSLNPHYSQDQHKVMNWFRYQ